MTDRPRGGLLALCLAELVSWGLLYYSLPVAVTPISADMGWSQTTTMAALSVGLVISAVAGIRVGRLLDAGGPRSLFTKWAQAAGYQPLAIDVTASDLASATDEGRLTAWLGEMSSSRFAPLRKSSSAIMAGMMDEKPHIAAQGTGAANLAPGSGVGAGVDDDNAAFVQLLAQHRVWNRAPNPAS